MNVEKIKKPAPKRIMSEEHKEKLRLARLNRKAKPKADPPMVEAVKPEPTQPQPTQKTESPQKHRIDYDFKKLDKLDNIESILMANNRELQELKLLKAQKNKIKEQKQKLKEVKKMTVDKESQKSVKESIDEADEQYHQIDYSVLFR